MNLCYLRWKAENHALHASQRAVPNIRLQPGAAMHMLRLFPVLAAFQAALGDDPVSTINVTFTFQGTTTTVMGIDRPIGRSFLGVPFAAPPVGPLRYKVRYLTIHKISRLKL